jgi:hypothetical protein
MMCNPTWRDNDKTKWADPNGFILGLKTNFRTDQAWEVPPVGNIQIDPYNGGHFEVGHSWRSR